MAEFRRRCNNLEDWSTFSILLKIPHKRVERRSWYFSSNGQPFMNIYIYHVWWRGRGKNFHFSKSLSKKLVVIVDRLLHWYLLPGYLIITKKESFVSKRCNKEKEVGGQYCSSVILRAWMNNKGFILFLLNANLCSFPIVRLRLRGMNKKTSEMYDFLTSSIRKIRFILKWYISSKRLD